LLDDLSTVVACKQLKKSAVYQNISEYVAIRSLGKVKSSMQQYKKTVRNYHDNGSKYTLTIDHDDF
jgi:ACT domain-containing protein